GPARHHRTQDHRHRHHDLRDPLLRDDDLGRAAPIPGCVLAGTPVRVHRRAHVRLRPSQEGYPQKHRPRSRRRLGPLLRHLSTSHPQKRRAASPQGKRPASLHRGPSQGFEHAHGPTQKSRSSASSPMVRSRNSGFSDSQTRAPSSGSSSYSSTVYSSSSANSSSPIWNSARQEAKFG